VSATILTIDDEEPLLNLLQEFLEIEGHRVLQATTPREAKALVAEETPDLIITDLQLEKSDGLILVEELRETLPDIPVILLTGVWFDEQTIDENLSQKISAYHNKTAPLSELNVLVQRLLQEARTPRSS
jgi:DNA-binding response OmpR family regulator